MVRSISVGNQGTEEENETGPDNEKVTKALFGNLELRPVSVGAFRALESCYNRLELPRRL